MSVKLKDGYFSSDKYLKMYEEYEKLSTDAYHKKREQRYDSTYVFDENQSVKWNREKVEEENEKLKQSALEADKKAADFYKEIGLKMQDEIMENYGFPAEIVAKAFSKAYQESHSYGYAEVLSTFSEILDYTYAVGVILLESNES